MSKYAAKVTSKGQVTIPKVLRERFGLAKGDYLVLEPEDERIVVTKAPVAPTEDFSELAGRIAERFEEREISRSDVEEAIQWARQKKS